MNEFPRTIETVEQKRQPILVLSSLIMNGMCWVFMTAYLSFFVILGGGLIFFFIIGTLQYLNADWAFPVGDALVCYFIVLLATWPLATSRSDIAHFGYSVIAAVMLLPVIMHTRLYFDTTANRFLLNVVVFVILQNAAVFLRWPFDRRGNIVAASMITAAGSFLFLIIWSIG